MNVHQSPDTQGLSQTECVLERPPGATGAAPRTVRTVSVNRIYCNIMYINIKRGPKKYMRDRRVTQTQCLSHLPAMLLVF